MARKTAARKTAAPSPGDSAERPAATFEATLPAGTGTQNLPDEGKGPPTIERGRVGQNRLAKYEDEQADVVRLQKDKARWPGTGADAVSPAQLMDEQVDTLPEEEPE
ncbi:MAG: hypothetical protein DDT26_00026 [Dehalococcoidia bacterium]|nr:hypothetical protein [Chloroflexota bacterium]